MLAGSCSSVRDVWADGESFEGGSGGTFLGGCLGGFLGRTKSTFRGEGVDG